MGNAAPQSAFAVRSDDDDGDRPRGFNGGGGGVFRLPLYRGERDAFLPVDDDCHCDDDDACYGEYVDASEYGHRAKKRGDPLSRVPPPPLLSVEPKLTGGASQLVSPLVSPLSNPDGIVGVKSSVAVKGPRGCEGPSPESSPPSVVSSSDSVASSYGTCYTTLSSSSSPSASQGGGGIKSSWTRSGDRPRLGRRPLLHAPLPRSAPRRKSPRNLNGAGVLDCVRPPTARPARDSSGSTASRTSDGSSGSLASLFESCMRSTDDEKNEYMDDEEESYHSSRCDYERSVSLGSRSSGRSCSQGSGRYSSQHSTFSRGTHNSYHLAHANSRVSLESALSGGSGVASYTEEELAMPDGDEPTLESDLSRVRNYHVVATAALPWRTGTAVNPLLRAAHLLRRNGELKRERDAREGKDEGGGSDSPIGSGVSSEGDESIEGRRKTLATSNVKAPCLQRRKMDSEQRGSSGDGRPRERRVDVEGSPERDGREAEPEGAGQEIRDLDVHGGCDGFPSISSPVEVEDPPESPCSLDYSCFSFSEIATPGHVADALAERDMISPLGEEEEDSLLLSPFSPSEAVASAGVVRNGRRFAEQGRVTLVLPWLQDAGDRSILYRNSTPPDGSMEEEQLAPSFANREEQEAYIRSWLAEEAGMAEEAKELNIVFYPARYHKYYNSIFALGEICDLIPDEAADVCFLEEPEHLNWYRAPGCSSWRSKFRHCIGVIHTNYKAYARDHAPAGFLAAPLLAGVNSLVVKANCHRVVKLSGVLQKFAPTNRECVENMHGIRETYLKEGQRRRQHTILSAPAVHGCGTTEVRRAYFIGKLLWAKGFDQLLELEGSYRERTGEYFEIDIFGSGPDEREIKRAFLDDAGDDEGGILRSSFNKYISSGHGVRASRRHRLPANFLGPSDHSSLAGDAYSIFVNPSLSEVLCTTTAEAIAMNKWAIVPSHPSNAFFLQFPNCLSYRNRREFASVLERARGADPPPLSEELAGLLSWEAATARCVRAAAVTKRDAARDERIVRVKEGKASSLKKTFSGLWSGGSKGDLENMNACRSVSSSSSSSSSSSVPSEAATGYINVGFVTP